MSDIEKDPGVPLWTCALEPSPGGPSLESMTVGDQVLLKCGGVSIEPIEGMPIIEFVEEALKYTLHPLAVLKSESNNLELVVTGYKPGQFEVPHFFLKGANQMVRVENLKWSVQSVIEQQSREQPKEPYGPFGPWEIGWPYWLFGGAGGLLVLVSLMVYLIWKKRRDRRRLIERLELKSTALSPFNQFNKELRQAYRAFQRKSQEQERQKVFISSVNQQLRLYLSREFIIPAMDWSTRATLKDLKRRHRRIYKLVGADLKQAFIELEKAEGAGEISLYDGEQLLEMVRRSGEMVHQAREKKRR